MFDGEFPLPPASILARLRRGLVIPAHPLALDASRRFDEQAQRALTRYYAAAGAGGVAVGVHTTQFEIRTHGLFEPVLRAAAEVARETTTDNPQLVLIAGVVGETDQACSEARVARELGYHAALVSLAGLTHFSDEALLRHVGAVARELPVFGFYLQTAVGGRPLSYSFLRRFAELPNLIGFKISPFDRYRTIDVVRAIAAAGRADDVALYTGNDDAIVADLVTTYDVAASDGGRVTLRMVGGLLGHWAVWTEHAVRLLESVRTALDAGCVPVELMTTGAQITDINAALFDVRHDFAGAIAGVNEMLRRQGLLPSAACLDPASVLSPGQTDELDRVCADYPTLTDDRWVLEHREEWQR